jgi:hypothetical protein
LAHKSEAGLVALNIMNEPNLAAAACQMQNCHLGVSGRGNGGRGTCRSAGRHHPRSDWRLLLTLGAGGVLTEILGDTANLLLPAKPHRRSCRHSMSLRIGRLLEGYRGKPAADMEALCRCGDRDLPLC